MQTLRRAWIEKVLRPVNKPQRDSHNQMNFRNIIQEVNNLIKTSELFSTLLQCNLNRKQNNIYES